jgi:hypothetical protein
MRTKRSLQCLSAEVLADILSFLDFKHKSALKLRTLSVSFVEAVAVMKERKLSNRLNNFFQRKNSTSKGQNRSEVLRLSRVPISSKLTLISFPRMTETMLSQITELQLSGVMATHIQCCISLPCLKSLYLCDSPLLFKCNFVDILSFRESSLERVWFYQCCNMTSEKCETLRACFPRIDFAVAVDTDPTLVEPRKTPLQNIRHVTATNLTKQRKTPENFLRDFDSVEIASLDHLAPEVRVVGEGFLSCSLSLVELRSSDKFFAKILWIQRNFLAECISLTQLDLSCAAKVEVIDDNFLFGCVRLKQVNLSGLGAVQRIGKAFMCMCSALTEVDLSAFVALESVGRSFLSSCERLETVTVTGNGLCRVACVGQHFLSGGSSLASFPCHALEMCAQIGEGFLHNCPLMQRERNLFLGLRGQYLRGSLEGLSNPFLDAELILQ